MTHSEAELKRRRRLPRFPFWKDEKVVPGLTTAGAVRLFIITVLVAFIGLGMLVIYALDIQSALSKSVSDGRTARVADQARTDALIKADQARNDKAIRDLACLAVAETPSGKSRVTDELRKKYDCPPYKVGANPSLNPAPQVNPGTASPTPSGSPSVTSDPAVPSPSASVSLRASSPTVGRSSPMPTASASTATSTPLLNVPSVTCSLTGIFC